MAMIMRAGVGNRGEPEGRGFEMITAVRAGLFIVGRALFQGMLQCGGGNFWIRYNASRVNPSKSRDELDLAQVPRLHVTAKVAL